MIFCLCMSVYYHVPFRQADLIQFLNTTGSSLSSPTYHPPSLFPPFFILKRMGPIHQNQNELYLPSRFTHKEFVLVAGTSSAEESTDIMQTNMIEQAYK